MKHKSPNYRMAIPLPLEPPSGGSTRSRLRDRQGEILADIASQLQAGHEHSREVMQRVFRALKAERIVDAIVVFLITDTSEAMTLAFVEGFDTTAARRRLTLDFGFAICGNVAATGRAMHVSDIQNRLDPIADLVRSTGITAYACEPLVAGDQFFGTISFASCARKSFEVEQLLFFRSIAGHLALARKRAGMPAREMAEG